MAHSKRKNSNNLYITLGLFLIIISFFLFKYKSFLKEKKDNLDNLKINSFFIEKKYINDDSREEYNNKNKEENYTNREDNDYIAVLEIPKINLKRGIFDKNSFYNNVSKNIYVLKETTFPDESKNSHVILAAHSGNSDISYFNNINKLKIDDEVYLYYKEIKYTYKVSKRYEIEKTGKALLRLTSKSDITLITCISGTNKQVIYVASLIEEKMY